MNMPPASRTVHRPLPGKGSRRFFVPAILVACAAVLLFLGVDIGDTKDWLRQLGPWAPIMFVAVAVPLMSILVPKTAVSVTAGALFGTALGSALMVVIAVTAAGTNYAIGRWWLRESIDRMLADRSQRSDEEETLKQAIAETAADAGFALHLMIRLSPVPTMIISYSIGAVGGRLRPYLAAAAVAVIPQMLWVHSGTAASLGHDQNPSTLRWISIGLSVMMAIAISVIVPRKAMQRLAARRAAASAQ